MSSREACRIVGVNYRTGKRWRNGCTPSGGTNGASPIPVVAPSGPSRYLCEADRIHIADRLREKAGIRQIAAELGRSPSTISREIRRNGTVDPRGVRHYRPHAAQARADSRRPRRRPGKIAQSGELRAFIQEHLDLRWSPEQICVNSRRRSPSKPWSPRPEINPVAR
ncbi:transposase [Streptomyces sp. NPDC056817]|uniref:transposase n=1 Tax=Streptomyces sp. NPDC056817 TaxID=3345950 RepID=UPI0036ADB74C